MNSIEKCYLIWFDCEDYTCKYYKICLKIAKKKQKKDKKLFLDMKKTILRDKTMDKFKKLELINRYEKRLLK